MKKNKTLNWEVRHYSELGTHELYEILRLRAEVFVVEQNCPYQDLDGLDCACYHVLGWHGDNRELAAYARILPKGVDPYELVGEGDENHGGIGRVVVAPRHRGIGHELMNHAIDAYREKVGIDIPCIIHAQAHLKSFYESHGFKQSSGLCVIDGIDHIEMTWRNS
ncbi:MAG: GNAT family N-acetyltransferase [Bacteroidaceae bacterium]|nr:GNAT family N-acetyltransferase [Bacteroidaceae bacterium]MDO5482860.1 GNAT family N-acetyltransferase [Bacteroidaceae bacterium]